MKHIIPLALLAISGAYALAADGTYAANKNQAWTDTSGWAGNVVAEGSGYTATINRTSWSATRTLTLTDNITIGSIVVEGLSSSARKFGLVTTNSSVLTFDGGGSAALFSNTGNGPAQIDVAVVLASDLNLQNTPTDASGNAGSNYMGFGYGISSDNNSVLRTITILRSTLTPASPHDFRVALSGDVSGNIAIRQNSGNNLNLQTTAKTFYGGLYIRSGNVNSSGLGSAALGAANNVITFETRDNAADAAGTLNFTGALTLSGSSVASQSMVLQTDGIVSVSLSTGYSLTWAGQISGTGSFTKVGASDLILTHQNTYTGDTVIAAGKIVLGVDSAINSASDLVLSGGTLDANGHSNTFGTLSLQGVSVIDLGDITGNILTFADSSSVDWGAYALNIIGSFEDGASIRIGTDENGLTASQLAKITINGETAYLTNSGFLTTTIPEPALASLLTGALTIALAVHRRRRSC